MLSYHHLKIHTSRSATACLLGMALLSLWPSLGSSTPTLPALPQATIDTTYSLPTGGTTWTPAYNASNTSCSTPTNITLQGALNCAHLGDVIVLQAGTTYTGNFTLPVATGTGWIYVVSSNYSSLPAPGNRLAPTDKPNMATIVSPYGGSGVGIQTASGASNYRLVGIEMTPATGIFLYSIFSIGNGETSTSSLPGNIVIDRCYIHGDLTVGSRRGVFMNGISVAVVDSYISGFIDPMNNNDTQAVGATNSPGPILIRNNYLEASGENIIFGGSDPSIANLVNSDIMVVGNYINKPLAWLSASPAIVVKNLLELKNAQRVLIQGNYMSNNWTSAQTGFGILFTPRNQSGTAPWTIVQDVTFTYNTIANTGSGINMTGFDASVVSSPGQPTSSLVTTRILIQNNLIMVSGLNGSSGISFQIQDDLQNVTIDHNTVYNTSSNQGNEFTATDATLYQNNQFAFTNNIVFRGVYGFYGNNAGEGTPALTQGFTNWTFTNNALVGTNDGAPYPANTYFPANASAVGFVNYTGDSSGNYALASGSPYKNAGTDGLDLGANISALTNATTGVLGSGTLSPLSSLQVVP